MVLEERKHCQEPAVGLLRGLCLAQLPLQLVAALLAALQLVAQVLVTVWFLGLVEAGPR